MTRSKLLACAAVIGCLATFTGSSAQAAIVAVEPGVAQIQPTDSPITLDDKISGWKNVTFSYTPTPAYKIFEVWDTKVAGTGMDKYFPSQSTDVVAQGIAALFGISTPTLVSNAELGYQFGNLSFSMPAGKYFDYVALHQDSGELVFGYTLGFNLYTLASDTNLDLSNARFYWGDSPTGGGPPPVNGVPEPATWIMMLAGFALLGLHGYRAHAKRRLIA